MSSIVDLCRGIAFEAHLGQKRKNGDDYIVHPERVSSMVEDEFLKCVAWLHDTIEDTDITICGLIEKNVPGDIARAVCVMTHQDGEGYYHYLDNIITFGSGLIHLKILDIVDNLCDDPSENAKKKYRKSIPYLLRKIS